jgi:hypothetical protein
VPAETKKSVPGERTDDPVRLYLREMGSVEHQISAGHAASTTVRAALLAEMPWLAVQCPGCRRRQAVDLGADRARVSSSM